MASGKENAPGLVPDPLLIGFDSLMNEARQAAMKLDAQALATTTQHLEIFSEQLAAASPSPDVLTHVRQEMERFKSLCVTFHTLIGDIFQELAEDGERDTSYAKSGEVHGAPSHARLVTRYG